MICEDRYCGLRDHFCDACNRAYCRRQQRDTLILFGVLFGAVALMVGGAYLWAQA